MIDKPADEWTTEDWEKLHRAAFELSYRVLDTARDQGSTDGTFSVQVAGFALIIAMGRLSGKHGFRVISMEDAWKMWIEGGKAQFEAAFKFERREES